jgi:uncharacterized membrane protein
MILTSKEQVLGTKMFLKLGRGIIDRQLLGLQHVNETVPPDQWIFRDVGFLIWGAHARWWMATLASWKE